ncbi:hypothetical protein J2W54_004951 [Rhodococcus fascians]|uniref:hypothetical protein n=1 Tax=Nocardiaceae TaxID=85025 RepID=UPI00285513D0|nr:MULTISPECIES: hypothetical protein [Rhodococcus]MDR6912938.1 hypothetical protein [Rhodococcus sp. 3258]MDR6934535.1 hypothetical protein [Rhodococcus fascians]
MATATTHSPLITAEAIATATANSDAWKAIATTVRFEFAGHEPFAINPDGELTDEQATHTFRLDQETLSALATGDLSFLRAVTSRRVHVLGPIMTTFAIGQALQGLGQLRQQS